MTDVLDGARRDLVTPDATSAPEFDREHDSAPSVPRPVPAAWFLGALLLSAGLIHLVMVPVHWGESTVDGVEFLVAGALQVGAAVLVVARPGRGSWVIAVALSAACLAAWVMSRTAGLPFGSHQGTTEPIGFVDGVTAGLELASVVVGVVLVARGSMRSGRSGSRSGASLAAVGALAAFALTAAAIASPSAREHGGAAHHGETIAADDQDHGAAATDDLGFAELANGQMGDHHHGEASAEAAPVALEVSPADVGALSRQLALTAPLVAAYPTLADAKAAGYYQAGPFSPGLGIHYNPSGYGSMNTDGTMDDTDIGNAILIYDDITDDARLAGFMYMAYQDTEPEGFVGDLDRWHYHTAVCIVAGPDGIDTPFGADLTGITQEMCEAEGGSLMEFSGYMVHVWTVPGYESELGVFSDLNPKLTCPDGTYHRVPTAEIGDADTTCRNL